MKKLLKMEMYEFTHDYICLLTIGLNFILGIFMARGYLENDYFNLPLGGYQVFIAMLRDSTGFIILTSVFIALLMGKSFSNRIIALKIMSGNSRSNVFLCKVFSILAVSTIAMLIFPIMGAIVITVRYGWNVPILQSLVTSFKIVVCTALLDFVIFSVIIFFGVIFRDTVRTVSASVITIFFNALYLAYANDLKVPISMHPMRLLRTVLTNNSWCQFVMFSLYSIVLLSVILLVSYNIFRKCELK